MKIGDNIEIDKEQYEIVGIGSVPDYDAPLKDMSDSSVDSASFGLGFVSEKQYDQLKKEGKSSKTEEYVYSYILNNSMTNEELKNYLKNKKVKTEKIKDIYLKEMIVDMTKDKTDIENSLDKLEEGSDALEKGLKTLNDKNALIILTLNQLPDMYNPLKEMMESYLKGNYSAYKGSQELADIMSQLNYDASSTLDKYFDKVEIDNLSSFVKEEDNPRIKASIDDVSINKYAGIVAGVIIMILFTYVISVFIIHEIEEENVIIGSLYALGVKKNHVIKHYLTIPVIITILGGLVGTILGFTPYGTGLQCASTFSYFSVPDLETLYPTYIILYGVIMPPVVAIIVNYLTINKKLSQPVLKLIRNEKKNNKTSKLNLENLPFIKKFQIRQLLREKRSSFTLILGMFISLLISILALESYELCNNISIKSKEDTKYQYMYTYKYPTKIPPKNGEATYVESLKKEIYGYNLDVTLIGIDDDNKYFDYNVPNKKSEAIISSSMATKYHLKKGDMLVLNDEVNEINYAFKVKDVVSYSVGLNIFMNIESMRELFDKDDDYYNTVFSDKYLDIPAGRLYSTISKDDISKSSDVFITHMIPMVVMFIVVSIIIFITVMYLMMKVMIDRSALNISLVKIFGFTDKEVKKLYINGNFFTVALGALICIPLAKKCIDQVYPYLVSNVSCGYNITLSMGMYIGLYMGIILCYIIINQLLIRRIKKIMPVDALKNRE
ncbi:ABC transporter permease [Terrisporobacter glycolicus]|nr:ABC transporter permease [Terrisporobacter glycolicus]